ncbi:hypothetical protein CBI33_07515 [Rhodococcus erythropolis]|nr:hypothetical protein CBI33_07515 [Rhodococcus erythropolis]
MLRHKIFNAAAGHENFRITGEQVLATLMMPDPRIAHAVGGFDWGTPRSRIPNLKSSVPRLDILDDLASKLEVDDRTPPVVVLTGHTGIGKSTVASDYCHLNHNHYELVLWLDARDDGLLQAQIREYATEITGGPGDSKSNRSSLLATALSAHRGPWLVVFDGAPGRREIEPYVPTIGHGAVLVTSTNSTGWWPTADRQQIGPFNGAQALRCFASYAGIVDANIPLVAGTIESIVQRLGLIPLAVSMAGLYFRNAEGELAELVPDYFKTLDALDDSLAIPPGFSRTAFAAVATAVEQIGSGSDSPYARNAKILVYTASFLAPEMIPLNLIIPATTDPIRIDMADLPTPSAANPTVTRAIVSLLRTQTIAHRVLVNAQPATETDLSADCIQIHPLINEILRTKYVATAPPGAVQSAVTVLLGHLIPWLGAMRISGSFLALEQLRVHAETLLDFLDGNEPLSSLSVRHREVYLVAKAGVMAEVANCYANTARMQKSVEILNRLVIHYLENFPGKEWAQVFAMKHASDMLADMSRASVASPQIFQISGRILGMMKVLEQSRAASAKSMVYTTAHLSLQCLVTRSEYRNNAMLCQISEEIEKIADRDPNKSSNPEYLMHQVNQLIRDEDYVGVLSGIAKLRVIDTLPNDVITYDALEVVALLHVEELDKAFRHLDVLLAVDIVENHMVLDLRSGLSKVAQALRQRFPFHDEDTRLRSYFSRVCLRIDTLDRSIQAIQPPRLLG